jgi:hypothetical protein
MSAPESGELEQAIQDWRVAGLQLPGNEGQLDDPVDVAVGGIGRRGILLPRRVFEPVEYPLDRPDILDREFYGPWMGDVAGAVLKMQLGREAGRAIFDVAATWWELSKQVHEADVMCSVVQMNTDETAERHETVLGLWSNGRQYPTAEELLGRFTNDTMRDLSDGKARYVGGSTNSVLSTVIVSHVAESLRGQLTVVSGSHQLDAEFDRAQDRYAFRTQTVAGVAGNVLIARMPHQSTS